MSTSCAHWFRLPQECGEVGRWVPGLRTVMASGGGGASREPRAWHALWSPSPVSLRLALSLIPRVPRRAVVPPLACSSPTASTFVRFTYGPESWVGADGACRTHFTEGRTCPWLGPDSEARVSAVGARRWASYMTSGFLQRRSSWESGAEPSKPGLVSL